MKSTKTLFIAIAALACLPLSTEAATIFSKDAKPTATVVTIKAKTATTTAKNLRKAKDPIVVLMETLASSIDKVSMQIENLADQGADTIEAEGFIFDAKLRLHTVEIYHNVENASSTPTLNALTASSTPGEIRKMKESEKKKVVDDLKIVFADVLSAIKSLKKTIVAERERLDIPATEIPSAEESSSVSVGSTSTTTLSDSSLQ